MRISPNLRAGTLVVFALFLFVIGAIAPWLVSMFALGASLVLVCAAIHFVQRWLKNSGDVWHHLDDFAEDADGNPPPPPAAP
jgi:hypothetical protein